MGSSPQETPGDGLGRRSGTTTRAWEDGLPAACPARRAETKLPADCRKKCCRIERNLPGGHPQTRGRDWALGQTKLVSPVTICPAEEIFQRTCAVAAPRGFLHLICQCSQVARPHHPSCTESPFALLSSVHVVRSPVRRIHQATASPSTLKSAGCTCQFFWGGHVPRKSAVPLQKIFQK